MKRTIWNCGIGLLPIIFFCSPALSQGIFENEISWPPIGDFNVPGSVSVSGSGENIIYLLEGNGNGLGNSNDADEGFYLYQAMDGSWSLQCKIAWDDPASIVLGSAGLMIREEADNPSSRHYSTIVRFQEEGAFTQTRYRNLLAYPGLPTQDFLDENDDPIVDPGSGLWLRVTHIKPLNLFLSEYSMDGGIWIIGHVQVLPWDAGTLAYGLFIANDEDNDLTVKARAENVTLSPAPPIAERQLSQAAFQSGDMVSISLNVYNSSAEAIDLSMQETIPEGWTAATIGDGGTLVDGVVTWNLTGVPPGKRVVTYQVTAPASPQNRAEWSGAIVDGLITQGDSGLLLSEGGFSRVKDGLLVLYTFEEGGGNTVTDVSGVGDPLNLTIRDENKVIWGPNSLSVIGATKIRSGEPALKLWDVFTDTSHDSSIAIEAWVSPANTVQSGPARMITYSDNASYRNFTLGQAENTFNMRLRTGFEIDDNNRNGTKPFLLSSAGSLSASLTHVVFVRNAQWDTFIYVNNEIVTEEGAYTDDFYDNWDDTYEFGLGNEINDERPWLGEFFLVAIYNQWLTPEEIAQNFAAGPGDTTTDIAHWSLY